MSDDQRPESQEREDFEPPTAEEIETLVGFFPLLNDPTFAEVKWHCDQSDGVVHLPWIEYGPEAGRLMAFLASSRFVQPFDWPAWQDQAERYVEEPQRLRSASMADIQRLLTTHLRKERFCEGHFAAMLSRGHIAAIVARVAELAGA